MAHGFSAVKDMRLDRFAEVFAAAGLACLVFDYRGFGASDGTPRQDIDPQAQLIDYRNAISAARTLPEIDGDRIGVWGTSYSGAHALMLGAIDRRVRCTVAQVPMIDGWQSFGRLAGADGLATLVEQLIAERERIYAGGAPAMIPVVTAGSDFAALPTPDAWEWFQAIAHLAPSWRNQVTLRSLDRLFDYAPAASSTASLRPPCC
jgi:pimeloyl-ACP methyl ester carboxylesterase